MTPDALPGMRKRQHRMPVSTKRRPTSRHGGFLRVEVSTALVRTGLLIGVVVAATVAYDRALDYYTAHHQAQLAAESYVESLRAGHAPTGDDKVRYETSRQPGEGPWQGLTRLTVTATVTARHGREVSFSLSTYLPLTELRPAQGLSEATP